MTTKANNDEVICPKCVHQFRAIPVNVQEEIATLKALLKESYDHHEYCGWGDSWERECARDSDLPGRIQEALK